jgi:O-antigen/teichoic acid export membrane protein
LWAAAAAVSAKLLRDVYLLFVQYRNFFKPFYSLQTDHHVSWRNEIWPMQWRLAIAGVATYFAASLYNPVMFRYHGAAVAGQMGMTIQMVNGMQLVPMAWVLTKVPRYGMLIARGDYGALDRLWLRNSVISIVIALFGCGGVLGVVYVLRAGGFAIARRILSPLPIALLLAGAVLLQAVQCFVAYLRAHKQEPIFVANIVMALSAGAMVWILGSRVGPAGAAVANVIQMIATFIWIGAIWWRCRVRWHAPAGEQRA